ncbi:helix-turn-helix domain-containing protein [Nocardiopsis terrae]
MNKGWCNADTAKPEELQGASDGSDMALKEISPVWRKYGAEVRKKRKQRGFTQVMLAPLIGLSPSSISYIESGHLAPHKDHALKLDEELKANKALMRLWEKYTNQDLVPAGFREVVDFEQKAVELRFYQPMLVPGLVQIPEYARALFLADQPHADDATIDRRVEQRMHRQKIFNQVDRPLVSLVLEETVLRRVVRDKAVMRAQLARLEALIGKRLIRCQVLPQAPRELPGLPGGFRVIVLEDQPAVVAAEHAFDEVLIDDTDQVRHAVSIFGGLQGEALSPRDSLDLIREIQQEGLP